jgi:hypothetical protein
MDDNACSINLMTLTTQVRTQGFEGQGPAANIYLMIMALAQAVANLLVGRSGLGYPIGLIVVHEIMSQVL